MSGLLECSVSFCTSNLQSIVKSRQSTIQKNKSIIHTGTIKWSAFKEREWLNDTRKAHNKPLNRASKCTRVQWEKQNKTEVF